MSTFWQEKTEAEVEADEIPDAQLALTELPVQLVTDNKTLLEKQFFEGVEIIRKRAPMTAKELWFLWDEYSTILGTTITTIGQAFEHRQLRNAAELEKNPVGRPMLQETIDKVEATVIKSTTLEAKRTAKAESKAQYEARLAKYARRRTAINKAKASLAEAEAHRKSAQTLFNEQWDAYIAQHRTHYTSLKAIPADEWPDVE